MGKKYSDVIYDECEWCGQTYPVQVKERYFSVGVFDKTHKICGDCYDHLKETHPEEKEQTQE
jgi:hypothetical protein